MGAAARDKDMINVPDAYADERFNRDVDRETGFSTRSVLCCPILDSYGSTVAVFEAINPLHGGPFGERDVNLCPHLTDGGAKRRPKASKHFGSTARTAR